MNQETISLIKERFVILSPVAQEYLGNPVWAQGVRTVATQNGLTEDQGEGVLLEFILLIVGLSHEEDYVMEIKERLGLTEEVAQKISVNVLALIPSSVRSSLKELCAKELAADHAAPSAPKPAILTPSVAPAALIVPSPSSLLPRAPHTTPQPQTAEAPTSIFEEKLKRVFTVPRADARLLIGNTSPAPAPSISVAPVPPHVPIAPVPTPTPSVPRVGIDPYREPAE